MDSKDVCSINQLFCDGNFLRTGLKTAVMMDVDNYLGYTGIKYRIPKDFPRVHKAAIGVPDDYNP